jgi:hypothetical protein
MIATQHSTFSSLKTGRIPKDLDSGVISIVGWIVRKFNEHLLKRFSDMLGLDFSSIKSNPAYETLRNYEAIAA